MFLNGLSVLYHPHSWGLQGTLVSLVTMFLHLQCQRVVQCVQGVKLIDTTVLLSPVISSWLSGVGVKMESYAAAAVAVDSQGGPRSWATVDRLQGKLCSSSVVDLFYMIVNGVDKVAARAIVKRSPDAAAATAEALAAASGGAIRYPIASHAPCCTLE